MKARSSPQRATRRAVLATMGSVTLMAAGMAKAQFEWRPTRPITIVLPLPAGGGPDTTLRILAKILERRWGQPVIVDNKPGASGLIGLKQVSQQAPADGHAVAFVLSSHIATDLLSPQLDLANEFNGITALASSPLLFMVNSESPYKSLKDVVEAARAEPGKLTYSSAGLGTIIQIGIELLLEKTGGNMLHVPFRGGIPAITALAAKQVDFTANIPGSSRALIQAGRVRVLAVAAAKRLSTLPDVPTVQEALGFEFAPGNWSGFALRKGTPSPIVAAWHAALVEASRDPAIIENLAMTDSLLALSDSPATFEEQIRRQYKIEGDLIKRLNIKPQ